MPSLAYSYVRFSSPPQADGDSERRQNDTFDDYCESHGLTQGPRFTDKGRSGFKAEHLNPTGELRRFLNLTESGDIEPGSTLVVENLDRLGRQEVYGAFGIFSSILNAGIRIVTLPKGQAPQVFTKETMDLGNLIMVVVDMARAHEESRRRQELLSAAFANKQALARTRYEPMGAASCPLWLELKPGWRSYEQDSSAYKEIPERADAVRRIFQLAIDGHGKGTIAKKLNESGVLSFKAENKKLKAKGFNGLWGTSSVDKVLKNRAVFGDFQPTTTRGLAKGKTVKAGDPIPGYFPTVVSVDVYYQAQQAIDGRRTSRVTTQSAKFNIWQKLAVCEKCGGYLNMVHKGAPPKGGSYLRCANIGKGGCAAKHYRLEATESVFRGMLVRLDALSLVKDSSAEIERQLRTVEGKLVEATRKLATLQRTLDEDWESPTFLSAVRRVEGEVRALEKQSQNLKADLAAESSIGWHEFLKLVDLTSYEGRAKANAVVRRLGVVVQIGPSGYLVTQNGEPRFQMDYRDGRAGYLTRGGFKGAFLTFVPVDDVPSYADAEDADQARYDALEDEGQPSNEY